MLQGELTIDIDAYFEIPKSASKKNKQLMNNGGIRPTKKPDLDNIMKIVCDALNKVAYADDSQIVSAIVKKFYDEMPRVEIDIREVG
jgi:Holliday junction resolvase RusA-like endonuclease